MKENPSCGGGGVTLVSVAILAASLMGVACKPSDEFEEISDVQTIDNFAARPGVALRRNHCGIQKSEASQLKNEISLVVDEDNIVLPEAGGSGGWTSEHVEKLKGELYSVLARIPPNILAVFFSVGGKIDLSRIPTHEEPIWKVCREVVERKGSRFVEDDLLLSCWRKDEESGAVTIFIDPLSNGESGFVGVQHATVREFGKVFSEDMLKLEIKPDPDVVGLESGESGEDGATAEASGMGEAGKRSENPKISLVMEAREDVSPNVKRHLDNLVEALWKDVYGTNRREGATGKETMSAGRNGYDLYAYRELYYSDDDSARRVFQSRAFAESFDSYYCSGETQERFRKDFPGAYCEMKYLDRSLRESLGDLIALDDSGVLGSIMKSFDERIPKAAGECPWELEADQGDGASAGADNTDDGDPEGVALALGNPTPTQKPTYVAVPTYQSGGYTKGGSYGTQVSQVYTSRPQPPRHGCRIACAIGSFVGTVLGSVARAAVNVAAGVRIGVQAGVGISVNSHAGLYGGVGIRYVPRPHSTRYVIGGGSYGRPPAYPTVPPVGTQYPQPCYSNQTGYQPVSQYQTAYQSQFVARQFPNQAQYSNQAQYPNQSPTQSYCAPPARYPTAPKAPVQPYQTAGRLPGDYYRAPSTTNSSTTNFDALGYRAQSSNLTEPTRTTKKKKKSGCGVVATTNSQAGARTFTMMLMLAVGLLLPVLAPIRERRRERRRERG